MNPLEHDRAPQDQFLECYDAENDAIFRFCYLKIGNRERALDLTQETFLRAWEYIKEGNTIKNLRAFVFHVAKNLIIDEYRKKERTNISLDSMLEIGYDRGTNEIEEKEVEREFGEILSLMHQLSDEYREVLTLRFVEDLSVKDIARILKETENATSVRIHRALEKLRLLYEAQ